MPVGGSSRFNKLAAEIVFGEEFFRLNHSRISSVQSLSGTGALRIAFEFMRLWYPYSENVKVWAPEPTWPTHHFIANGAHFESASYRYFDSRQKRFNLEWMAQDISRIQDKQIILLHACAHNPTGSDPSP